MNDVETRLTSLEEKMEALPRQVDFRIRGVLAMVESLDERISHHDEMHRLAVEIHSSLQDFSTGVIAILDGFQEAILSDTPEPPEDPFAEPGSYRVKEGE